MMRWLLLLLGLGLVVGCDDSATGSDTDDLTQDAAPGGDATNADGGGGGDTVCKAGETACVDGKLRTCLDTEDGWLVERCEDSVCVNGACVASACEPGSRRCTEGGIETCLADGSGYGEAVACPAERAACVDGVCLAPLCTAGEVACSQGVLLTCADDGMTWEREPCGDGFRCVDGACAPANPEDCEPGAVLCGPDGLYTCAEDGARWIVTPCPDGQACQGDRCVECARDENCADGETCQRGQCVGAELIIATETLPPAQVGTPYTASLTASQGEAPYVFAADSLPPGLALSAAGVLSGTPTQAGEYGLTFRVTDAAGATASAQLVLDILEGGGLVIATECPLAEAEEGTDYTQTLTALGGTAPLGWMLIDGALPAGLVLGADGTIAGIPSQIGHFDFTLRVVDAGRPPEFAEVECGMDVKVAPLAIIGDQSFEIPFVNITVVVLPMIAPPIPYRTELQAKGGLRPYHWREVDINPLLQIFLPNAGLPDGLSLDNEGVLQGFLPDASGAIDLQIPLTEFHLTGFFFQAEVSDSQDPAQTQTGLFLMPTVAIDFGNLPF